MYTDKNDLLTKAKDLLKEETTTISYMTWIKNMEIESINDNKIVLVALSKMQKDAIETRFFDLISNNLMQQGFHPFNQRNPLGFPHPFLIPNSSFLIILICRPATNQYFTLPPASRTHRTYSWYLPGRRSPGRGRCSPARRSTGTCLPSFPRRTHSSRSPAAPRRSSSSQTSASCSSHGRCPTSTGPAGTACCNRRT